MAILLPRWYHLGEIVSYYWRVFKGLWRGFGNRLFGIAGHAEICLGMSEKAYRLRTKPCAKNLALIYNLVLKEKEIINDIIPRFMI